MTIGIDPLAIILKQALKNPTLDEETLTWALASIEDESPVKALFYKKINQLNSAQTVEPEMASLLMYFSENERDLSL